MSAPVVLFLYNRPASTARVLAAIRRARPDRLVVVADGPRSAADAEACHAARRAVAEIDWPCRVERIYSDENLGCGRRLSSGLDAVFELHETAIILEDDCLPTDSFFPFCRELLERFRDEPRVMTISGFNALGEYPETNDSYLFARMAVVWGWASWRRAWRLYDVRAARAHDADAGDRLRAVIGDPALAEHLLTRALETVAGRHDTWDYQWMFCQMLADGLTVLPRRSLIRNIGFDDRATHTRKRTLVAAVQESFELEAPLRHPQAMTPDPHYDRAFFELVEGAPGPATVAHLARRLLARRRFIQAAAILQAGTRAHPQSAALAALLAEARAGLKVTQPSGAA
jgi:hypothetical protein